MPLAPLNGADTSGILKHIYEVVPPEQVISLFLRCDARSADPSNHWHIVQQVLAQPAVYEAFGIKALPQSIEFNSTHGLEVIGTMANMLCGGTSRSLIDDVDVALAEARKFFDVCYLRDYYGAVAYSCHNPWCSWFNRHSGTFRDVLDETLLIRNRNEWWLLAVTDSF